VGARADGIVGFDVTHPARSGRLLARYRLDEAHLPAAHATQPILAHAESALTGVCAERLVGVTHPPTLLGVTETPNRTNQLIMALKTQRRSWEGINPLGACIIADALSLREAAWSGRIWRSAWSADAEPLRLFEALVGAEAERFGALPVATPLRARLERATRRSPHGR
jgi:hypothetical protein